MPALNPLNLVMHAVMTLLVAVLYLNCLFHVHTCKHLRLFYDDRKENYYNDDTVY